MNILDKRWLHPILLGVACTTLTACATHEDAPLQADTQVRTVIEEGVPGGVTTSVSQLVATVTAMDYTRRYVTLMDRDGRQQRLEIGPGAVNFEQVKVGDVVKVTLAEEVVIGLRHKGQPASDGGAVLAATAKKGEKPAAVTVSKAEVTATVTAIDLANHTATLTFPDGSEKVVLVRKDIDLGKYKTGQEVVIRATSLTALSVTAP